MFQNSPDCDSDTAMMLELRSDLSQLAGAVNKICACGFSGKDSAYFETITRELKDIASDAQAK